MYFYGHDRELIEIYTELLEVFPGPMQLANLGTAHMLLGDLPADSVHRAHHARDPPAPRRSRRNAVPDLADPGCRPAPAPARVAPAGRGAAAGGG